MIPAIPMPAATPTEASAASTGAAEGAEGGLPGLFAAALAAVTGGPETPMAVNIGTTEGADLQADSDALADSALLVDPTETEPDPTTMPVVAAPVPAPPPVAAPPSTPVGVELAGSTAAGPGARFMDTPDTPKDGDSSTDGGADGGTFDLAEPESTAPFRDPASGLVREAPEVSTKPTSATAPLTEGARAEATAEAGQTEPVMEVDTPAEPQEISEPRVRVRGLDRARVDVPLPGGDRVRAEVSVQEGVVDVRLDTGAELGAAAVREIDALRDGLAEQGLDLGDLDFGELDREDEEPEHENAETSTNRSEDEPAARPWRRGSSDDDPTRGAFVRRTM